MALFTFLIGVDETPIAVHSGAIAALSSPLERLVNGPFKEAQESVARFPDIEVEDFEKICEVAYGGSLRVSEMRTIDQSQLDIKEGFWLLSQRINGQSSYVIRDNKLTAHVLHAVFEDLNEAFVPKSGTLFQNTVEHYLECGLLKDVVYPSDGWAVPTDGQPSVEQIDKVDKYQSNQPHHYVNSILMGYSRVYLFAEKYLVTVLQRDAKAGLRKFLVSLDVYRPTRLSIMKLIQYVYNDEIIPDRGDEEAMHPLREMVVHFVALHLSAFRDFPPHRDLLRREGEYAVDLQDIVGNWLL
ncbi:hypothetical protein N0V94_000639 [Neodidymelliopsis sp. IMI 364377]|nr:hypothetical protein N0V94_000639 [Neodidymelliopsis sp. IMI 364377]